MNLSPECESAYHAAIDAAVASGAFFQEEWQADCCALPWDPPEQDAFEWWEEGACTDPECFECNWLPADVPDPASWRPFRVHGVSGARATVTRSIARERARFGGGGVRLSAMKRDAHRRHRRAWRVWAGDTERAEPSLRSLTSWEVW